jgi:hypothetical protein
MLNIHAHVESESADCDGRYSRTYTYTPEVWISEESDFIAWVLTMTVDTSAEGGRLEITQDTLGHDGQELPMFEWSQPTEEGFIAKAVRFCTEPGCADAPATQRDHSAEAAGY